jgi:hypothetical protein
MISRLALSLLLLSMPAQPPQGGIESYPEVIAASVPFYPGLAWALKMGGIVEIALSINKGVVVDAKVVSTPSAFLSSATLTNVKTWKFRTKERKSFSVKYVYTIEGEPTDIPQTPKIELDLPSLVKVTARPFKPTTSD